ncbi:MAG: S1C family serine protease [Minisyncoccales bacterium]
MDGENISFAVPINKAKRDVEQVLIQGKIAYPFLGIKYLVLNDEYAKELNLNVNYGALIADEPLSITPNSPAEKAELKEGDIILEFDHQKISTKNTLAKIIQDYFPGQEIEIKVLRNEKEFLINVVLGDWNDF